MGETEKKMKDIEKRTGYVSQYDINIGIRDNCVSCPVAIALQSMFPEYTAHVSDGFAYLNHPTEIDEDNIHKCVIELYIAKELIKWINNFDCGDEVKPIQLGIRSVPEFEDFPTYALYIPQGESNAP